MGAPIKQRLAFGSWPSPISAATVAAGLRGTLWQVRLSGESVYWLEVRPHEAGRTVVMRRSPAGGIETPHAAGHRRAHPRPRIRRG